MFRNICSTAFPNFEKGETRQMSVLMLRFRVLRTKCKENSHQMWVSTTQRESRQSVEARRKGLQTVRNLLPKADLLKRLSFFQ